MPNSLSAHLLVYALSFVVVWFGSGLVVSSISNLAKTFKLPAFTVSFFLLGIFTSLPEIAIGTLSIINDDPMIYIGNLLGGVIVIFLLIIPLLGLIGGGVKIPKALNQKDLLLILAVVTIPTLLTLDNKLARWEGGLLLTAYSLLFVFISKRQSLAEKISQSFKKKKKPWKKLILKTGIGVILLFAASQQIINSTLFFSDVLRISPFFMSLLVVSLGTNIPELSIVIRSVLQKQQDIALADYLGSAVTNTLLLGILTLVYGKSVTLPNHFLQRFILLICTLSLFFFFSRSKNTLSRLESLLLLIGYGVFLFIEVLPILN